MLEANERYAVQHTSRLELGIESLDAIGGK